MARIFDVERIWQKGIGRSFLLAAGSPQERTLAEMRLITNKLVW